MTFGTILHFLLNIAAFLMYSLFCKTLIIELIVIIIIIKSAL